MITKLSSAGVKILTIQAALFFLFSCGGKREERRVVTRSQVEKPMEKANKAFVKKESEEIESYIKRHNLTMLETGTGLRYQIYQKGPGIQAQKGNVVLISFTIKLMNGTQCYATKKNEPKQVLIGQDEIESGIHEGLTLMHVGDKALFILPPNLAHGLIGDLDKIPPLETIIYDVELLQIVR